MNILIFVISTLILAAITYINVNSFTKVKVVNDK